MATVSIGWKDPTSPAAIVQPYFAALADGRFERVPWAENVVLRTSLHPDTPFNGRLAVESFFRPIAGQLGAIRLVETYFNSTGTIIVSEAFVGPLHVMDKFVIAGGEIVEQENIFDPRPVLDGPPAGGISREERALLIETLEASRDRLRSTIETAPRESWHRKPADGGWSATECAEHLVLSEEALLRMVRQDVLTTPVDPAVALELKGKDGAIVRAMENRANRQATFDFLKPAQRWSDQALVLDAFLARRADTLDYCRTTRDPLHYHAAPLGPFGLTDAYQWLLLIAAHTNRHIAQMLEALRTPENR